MFLLRCHLNPYKKNAIPTELSIQAISVYNQIEYIDKKLKMLDFCYTSKSKLFKTLNGFTHGLGPKVWRFKWLLSILGLVLYK